MKKWYRESNGKKKVLAIYCGQSTNAAKISRIVKAIDLLINGTIKEKDIEELNPVSLWITVNVKDSEKAKALIKYKTVMTMEKENLVIFQSITNRSPNYIYIQIVATAPRMIRCTGPLVAKAKVASILKSIWGNRAEIEVLPTTNADFVFTAKIMFKPNCRRTFPAKYKMNQITELTL